MNLTGRLPAAFRRAPVHLLGVRADIFTSNLKHSISFKAVEALGDMAMEMPEGFRWSRPEGVVSLEENP